MRMPLSALRKVYKAFMRSDGNRRKERIRRSLWCTQNLHFQAAITSDHRHETAAMESEVQATFVDGHFISTLLLSMAYCEHTLSDWLVLKEKNEPPRRNLERIINLVKSKKILNESFWSQFQALQERRNTYAHRSWESIPEHEPDVDGPLRRTRPHTQSLTARTRPPYKVVLSAEERDKQYPSPRQLMEQDAKAALLLMDAMRHLRHHSGITRDPWSEFNAAE